MVIGLERERETKRVWQFYGLDFLGGVGGSDMSRKEGEEGKGIMVISNEFFFFFCG